MKKIVTPIVVSMFAAGAAFAQTADTTSPTEQAPAEKIEVTPPVTKPAPNVTPSDNATSLDSAAAPAGSIVLTDEQAKAWVDKPVYSSDEKNLGEVAAVARDSSGNVSELHADIGGFLGIGETRVRVMPAEFTMANDKITLNVTADQAKRLPQISK